MYFLEVCIIFTDIKNFYGVWQCLAEGGFYFLHIMVIPGWGDCLGFTFYQVVLLKQITTTIFFKEKTDGMTKHRSTVLS